METNDVLCGGNANGPGPLHIKKIHNYITSTLYEYLGKILNHNT